MRLRIIREAEPTQPMIDLKTLIRNLKKLKDYFVIT